MYLNHSADHIRKEQVDMNLMVREALENYRIPAGEKKLQFSYMERSVDTVTDMEIMRKILDNLVSNAVSYTPDGGRIDIHLSERCLVVHNTGAHILTRDCCHISMSPL